MRALAAMKSAARLCATILLAASIAFALACAAPPRASAAPWFSLTDVNGAPIESGSAIDVNVLQQGVVFSWIPPVAGKANSCGFSITCDETGETVSNYNLDASFDSETKVYASTYSVGAIVPGRTYSVGILWQYLDTVGNQTDLVDYDSLSYSFSVTGGNGGGGTAADGPGDAPGGPEAGGGGDAVGPGGPGAAGGGGGPSGSDQNAETESDPSSQQTATGENPSAEQSALAPDGPAVSGDIGASSSAVAVANGGVPDDAASDGDAHAPSGTGRDGATLRSGASALSGPLTGAALADLGEVYGVAGASAGAQVGGEPTAKNALDLVITGIPYAWLALCILFAAAAPFGLLLRYAGFRVRTARPSRLEL